MAGFYSEDNYERSIIDLFMGLGYRHVYGPDIERDFASPFYEEELQASLYRLNPTMPEEAIHNALFKLKNFENAELVQKNEVFMDYIQHGIEVHYLVKNEERSGLVYLVDYENIRNNSFVAANQWTFIENSKKRPDILLFLNGLPIVLMELKSPSREETDVNEAYLQIRNYMKEIPTLFIFNCICVISDQATTKAGTITSGLDRFMAWKTKDGSYENTKFAQYETFFEGIFERERLLDIIKNFICFSNEGLKKTKILAGYHQYFAVKKAIVSTHNEPLRRMEKVASSGIRRVVANPCLWFSMHIFCSKLWTARPLWSSQTEMTWMINSSDNLLSVKIFCVRIRCTPRAGNI